jgi:predicted glycosyltransferase
MLKNKSIWIDTQYPPNVHFFNPIIKELKKRKYNVIVSARDAFETCDLLVIKGYKYIRIGKYPGKKKVSKAFGTLLRALQLVYFFRNKKCSIALNFGSPSQSIASFLLGIKTVCITDYEHAKIKPWIWLFKRVIVPAYISDDKLSERGFDLKKVLKFPGLKEDIYKNDFEPDSSILRDLRIENSKVVVIVRPPATTAHYHNPESEVLLYQVLDYLIKFNNVNIVLLARKEQKEIIEKAKKNYPTKIIFPEKALNGLNLIYNSDLVISGGGTMNREAAVLEVPAYSIFKGKIGECDKYLEKNERLKFISSKEDIYKIVLKKRNIVWPLPDNSSLIKSITDKILFAEKI